MDTDKKLGQLQWKIGGRNLSLAKPWCGSIRQHRLSFTDWYTSMGASASAVPRLCVWGIMSPWKLEESWCKGSGSGRVEVDAGEQKTVCRSLLRNPEVNSSVSCCALVCHFATSLR